MGTCGLTRNPIHGGSRWEGARTPTPLFSCSASLPESLAKQFPQGVVDRRLWGLFLFLKIINLSFIFFKKNVHVVKKKKKKNHCQNSAISILFMIEFVNFSHTSKYFMGALDYSKIDFKFLV